MECGSLDEINYFFFLCFFSFPPLDNCGTSSWSIRLLSFLCSFLDCLPVVPDSLFGSVWFVQSSSSASVVLTFDPLSSLIFKVLECFLCLCLCFLVGGDLTTFDEDLDTFSKISSISS